MLAVALLAVVPSAFAAIGTCDTPGPIEVESTGGTTTPTQYATLGAAFTAINGGTHTGTINVEVCGSTTEGATPATLNSSGAGSASYTSVKINPLIDGLTISGNPAAGYGVVQLNGADNVTLDGDNPNTAGTNRNLTITNTASATTTYNSVVRLALSTLVSSADNVVIKNCVITGSATGRNASGNTSTTGSEHTTYGILVGGGASTSSTTAAPSAITSVSTTIGSGITTANFTASNNAIDACARGIALQGSAVTVAPNLTITNNVIGNATPGNTTTVYSRGITVQGFDGGSIAGNVVQNMAWYVGTATMGIGLGEVASAGQNIVVEKNIVNGVNNRNTGTYGAYGINLIAGNGNTIRNNFVTNITGDISGGGAFSTTFGIFGIRVAAGLNHKVYHNSVNLYGVRTGTSTATSLLSAALSITGTGLTGCDFRDNVLTNTQSGGAASTAYVSLHLPSGGSSAMNLTLNNNGYYSGTGAGQGIGFVGTSYSASNLYTAANFNPTTTTPSTNMRAYTSTLSAAGTNDNASFATTSAAPFVSATDLHIPDGTVTALESGGAPVGVTDDIDGQLRSAVAPDIGADEFNGVSTGDSTPPAITYTPLTNTNSTVSPTLPVTVTDASGVPTSGTGLPVVYYRKPTDAAYASNQCSFVSGSSYNCVLDYTKLPGGSVTAGDQVQYYVAAQDAASTPNVTTNPSAGAAGFTANPPAASTPPTSPNSYAITGNISGEKTVCATGCDFASLTNAGGAFDWVNNNTVVGNIIFDVAADLTAETGTVALNQFSDGFTVLVRPQGAARLISGTNAAGLIKLNGADGVTIDGSLSGGTDRSLTITNTNAATTATVIWIASASATNGANRDTVRNCIVYGTGSTTVVGITAGSGTTLGNPAEAPNSFNTIQNNVIYKAQNSAYLYGPSAGVDEGWVVKDNTFGSTVAADKNGFRGMLIAQANNFTIKNNRINGVVSSSTSTATMTGIQLYGALSNGVVDSNVISDIKNVNTSGYGSNGMLLGATTGSNLQISNNVIYDVASYGYNGVTQADNGYGIMITGGSGYNIWFNSVRLTTNQTSSSGITAAINVASGLAANAIDLRDNIFANSQTVGTRYAIYCASAATAFTDINYNDYWPGTGVLGYLGAAQSTLTAWRTATGKDANSISGDPLFVSTTDLHVTTGSPAIATATPIASVPTDVTGRNRNVTTPTMGAYEFGCSTNADCNDHNVCTDDTCGGDGLCVFAANTAGCDDGNACTTGDVCGGGTCHGGTPTVCNDANACTTDACNTSTGACEYTAITCNDNNSCTDDTCNVATGCVFTANDNNTCNDGSVCTTDDHCSGGACVGTQPNCDDQNVCTNDSCNPTTGACVHTNAPNPCSDGNACTANDVCGDNASYAENFDGVTAPNLPAGWTTANVLGTATDVFKTVTDFKDTAPNAAWTADTTSASDKNLTSVTFVPTATDKLFFMHKYDLEKSSTSTSVYDGAVLEISINGAAFTDFVTAGGVFETGGYGLPITATSNPLYPRAAWSGDSTTFVQVKAAFPASAIGQSVQLRWRVGTDSSVGKTGYWLDSVKVAEEAYVCRSGAPLDCNDSNVCTTDSCDVASGCVHTAVTCDDGDVCTVDTCNSTAGCQFVPGNAGTVCRGSAGACDAVDTCNGITAGCPDVKRTDVCRPAVGICDAAEFCDGAGNDCPADLAAPSSTVCRASAGDCDVAEHCDGVAVTCPANTFKPSTVECRSAAGICDAAEFCTGSDANCPANAFAPDTQVCRPSVALCDPAETCTGTSGTCPPDVVNAAAPVGSSVALTQAAGTTTIAWTEANPGPFNVYRGLFLNGSPWAYNTACFAPGVAGPSVLEFTSPLVNQTFYYLVSRKDQVCSESSLGQASSGAEIPNGSPCP